MLYCKVILRRQSKQRMLLPYSVIQIQCKYKYNRMQIQIQCCIGREATSFQGNIPIVGCTHIAACYKNNSTCINDASCTTQYSTLYNQYAPFLPFPYLQCITLSNGLMFTCMNNSITMHTQHTNVFPVSIKLCMNYQYIVQLHTCIRPSF